MSPRTPLSAADLFVRLDREFRRRKPRECATCFVQLPYRVDARDTRSANWEMVLPLDCGLGCTMVLEELVLEFQALYDLAPENGNGRD